MMTFLFSSLFDQMMAINRPTDYNYLIHFHYATQSPLNAEILLLVS